MNILITGGSRGIGLYLAKHFHTKGDTVCIVGKTPEHVYPVKEQFGIDGFVDNVIAGDKVIQTAWTRGSFDVVIHAAGIFDGPPEMVVATNILGTWSITDAAAKHMTKGSIILFSGGGVGGPNVGKDCPALYAASKAAVVTLTECLARQYPHVQINAVAPGRVGTEMRDEIGDSPEKVTTLIEWLIRKEAKHVTGRLLAVRDGIWPKWIFEDEHLDYGKLRRMMP